MRREKGLKLTPQQEALLTAYWTVPNIITTMDGKPFVSAQTVRNWPNGEATHYLELVKTTLRYDPLLDGWFFE